MEKIVRQRRKKSKVKIITRKAMEMMPEGAKTIDGKAELIQMLIPLGLKAVGDLLQEEVEVLAGGRYRHEGGPTRWGKQAGSVYLGDEKFRIEVPRVRDDLEPRLRRVKGMKYLPELRLAIQRELGIQTREQIAAKQSSQMAA